MAAERFAKRMERRRRVRRRVRGSDERPRLSVYRSLNHIYAQVVSDDSGQTLAAASTLTAELREGLKSRRNVQAARWSGKRSPSVASARESARSSSTATAFFIMAA